MKFGLLFVGLGLAAGVAQGQQKRFDYAPIFYHSRPLTNSVSTLSVDQLIFEPEQGYLKSVLKALDISPTSQVLVYDSASFQKNKISPETPRAIYFNDSSYVGWIAGAELLEIISVDPFLGPIFYDVKQDPAPGGAPHRNDADCLDCHSSAKTQSVPGLFISSSYPKGNGRVASRTASHHTDFSERWGGWYVTGQTGAVEHRGNQRAELPEGSDAYRNLTDLKPFFDTERYLTPHSDVLALMVLEHQSHVFNLINRANYRVRLVMNDHGIDPNDPAAELPERVTAEIKRHAPALVLNLLFAGEAEMNGAISGCSGFADYFTALGPHDERGRSLREFDGKQRLFKYPCSYMVYSDSFQMLPAAFRKTVFSMLFDILTSTDSNEDYAHLSAADKKAIYEILRATVPELSNAWK